MSQTNSLREDVSKFLNNLRKYCGSSPNDVTPSPGIRAALRRGASEGTHHLAYQAVVQCGGKILNPQGDCDPCWLAVGAAFAFYPQPPRPPEKYWNFGSTCRVLAEPRKKDKDGKEISSFDGRFRRVLAAASAVDLARWVVQIARRARTAKPSPAALHYEELLEALLQWDARDRSLRESRRARWASAYWQPQSLVDSESEEL